ncbi:hypothetical protein [Streptomyces sp. NPDC050263]|uniref:hypothetical protein n=1 Tax=Streptomyces sp. NPDC050263 TaxID=3155037 RepID=UPI003411F948
MALLTAVSAGLATPASAAEVGTTATTIIFKSGQASFDNNPGNGSESRLWAWSSSGTIRVEYQHYDDSGGSQSVNPGGRRVDQSEQGHLAYPTLRPFREQGALQPLDLIQPADPPGNARLGAAG